MWKNVYEKIFKCRDKQYVITSVCAFPYRQDTIEKCNEYYKINQLNDDAVFREMYAFYALMEGRDFIPIGFADRFPKLNKLQELQPVRQGFFWCVGYVSSCLLKNDNKTNTIQYPTSEKFLNWLEHHCEEYSDDVDLNINKFLASNCLRQYVSENSKNKIDEHRVYGLIYNNDVIFNFPENKNWTSKDWINHLKNLKKRDIFEIIVNDFKK